MKLNAGYKQSDLGVLPEDWSVVPVGGRLLKKPAYGINAASVPFDSRLPTYLRITDITQDGRFDKTAKVSVDNPASVSYMLEAGDVVFARTGATVGKSYLYTPDDGPLVYAGFLIRLRPNPERLVPAFLWQFAQSHAYWNWITANSMRSGQPGINGREYAALQIPLPPTIAEQQAIVDALGDVDRLLASLELLIAKKRLMKQGAMQELLTGRRRLPGFSQEWAVRTLGSLGRWVGGMTPSMQNERYWHPGTVPWVSSGDVKVPRLSRTGSYISEIALQQTAAVELPAKSLFIVMRSGILRRYLPVAMNQVPMAINQDIKALIPDRTVDADYILHALTFSGDRILSRCLKSGTTVESLEFSWLKGFDLLMPTLPEQQAIAAVLSDLEAEITALHERLIKTRQLKQGMTYELLTGKVRLS